MSISPEILHKLEKLTPKQQLELAVFLSKLEKENSQKLIPFGKLSGILEGKIQISKDFDEPLEDFKDYM